MKVLGLGGENQRLVWGTVDLWRGGGDGEGGEEMERAEAGRTWEVIVVACLAEIMGD